MFDHFDGLATTIMLAVIVLAYLTHYAYRRARKDPAESDGPTRDLFGYPLDPRLEPVRELRESRNYRRLPYAERLDLW